MDTFEKKYYEALNDMRAIYPNLKGDAKLAVEHAFHELRESEDERIRKEMISFLRSPFIKENLTDEKVAPWLDWLEKQKEQEHICDSAQYEEGFKTGLEIGLRKQKEQKPIDYPYLPGWRKNRDNNKPELKRSVLMLTTHGVAEGEWLGEKWCQYRWSCELKDGEVLYWIHLSDLERLEKEGEEKQKEPENTSASTMAPSCWEVEQKEQKPAEWKPTEKQMNALNFAITYMFSTKANPTVLRDLYDDLLKLK